jgi:hypothetical protein
VTVKPLWAPGIAYEVDVLKITGKLEDTLDPVLHTADLVSFFKFAVDVAALAVELPNIVVVEASALFICIILKLFAITFP